MFIYIQFHICHVYMLVFIYYEMSIYQEEVSYVPVVGDVCNVEDNDVFYTATNNLFSCPEDKEADG